MSSELICLIPNNIDVPSNSNHFVKVSHDSLILCSALEWKTILSELNSTWITFATSSEAVESISIAIESWNAPETNADIIIDSSIAPQSVFYAWKNLPVELASCLYAPEAISGFSFSRENLLAKIANVDYPLWNFVHEHNDSLLVHESATTSSQPNVEIIQSLAPHKRVSLAAWVLEKIAQLPKKLKQHEIQSQVDFKAIQSGLLLWMHDLDRSHNISQSIEGEGQNVNGDYWHGIMHRQEPDDSNAKYWFRHVGPHPIFPKLVEISKPVFEDYAADCEIQEWHDSLLQGEKWHPAIFIDICSAARRNPGSDLEILARRIQHWEMLLLLEQTVNDAIIM